MGIEIERKFLVVDDSWREDVESSKVMRQGYLSNSGITSLRVRIGGERAHLNIKSGGIKVSRIEYEYEIPLADAEEMLANIAAGLVEKTRHRVRCGGYLWEVDVFEGANAGLVVAEIELSDEGEAFQKPDWAGDEVSHDARYYNINLIETPYSLWKDEC